MKPLHWLNAVAITAAAVCGTAGVRVVAAWFRTLSNDITFARALNAVGHDALSVALSQVLGFGFAIAVALRGFGPTGDTKETQAALGIQPMRPKTVGLACLLGASLQLPLSELSNLAQRVAPLSFAQRHAMQRLVEPHGLLAGSTTVLAFVVVAPVCEELLFRGALWSGLQRRHGSSTAVLLSALLFAAVHGAWAASIAALAAGLLLGLLRLGVRNTTTCIVVHASVNAVPLALPSRLLEIRGFNTVHSGLAHIGGTLVGASALLAALCLVLLWRTERADA